ncbi:hypothetical protein C5S32_06120 [ANME-1 cluster archaeon GoMg1]|nr:hypothetical protein [ANME-1 cluster archaeon GoMg1]
MAVPKLDNNEGKKRRALGSKRISFTAEHTENAEAPKSISND